MQKAVENHAEKKHEGHAITVAHHVDRSIPYVYFFILEQVKREEGVIFFESCNKIILEDCRRLTKET
jgi:hypothetical protein